MADKRSIVAYLVLYLVTGYSDYAQMCGQETFLNTFSSANCGISVPKFCKHDVYIQYNQIRKTASFTEVPYQKFHT